MVMGQDDLLAEALKLSVNARADLAAKLLRSLDEDGASDETDYDATWSEEIARRLDDIDSGKVALVSEEEAFRIIDADSDDPQSDR